MEQTASWAQRALALIIDWVVCMFVVTLIVGESITGNMTAQVYVHLLFVLQTTVFTALLGGSFGKLVVRLRVVRSDGSGKPVTFLYCLLRQVMVALVIPPLVYRPDGRGLHDMMAGTSTVTLQSLQEA